MLGINPINLINFPWGKFYFLMGCHIASIYQSAKHIVYTHPAWLIDGSVCPVNTACLYSTNPENWVNGVLHSGSCTVIPTYLLNSVGLHLNLQGLGLYYYNSG